MKELEIRQDMNHQRLVWKLERIGWAIMFLLLLAALAGLLGPGPLSRQIAGNKDGDLWIEYNRFDRYQSPSYMLINFRTADAQDNKVHLWIYKKYVEAIELKSIEPEPERVVAGADRIVYIFNVEKKNIATSVKFHFEPDEFGLVNARIGIMGGANLSFHQFLFP